ncbi:hypothetical protein C7C56_016485 [Massilia glaciei]|uniref:Uncharacterized protein n=2 Tax=Massilia glaciei TaxID=1524097 RepID=A0A2U2HIJ6_9BURK|nr:hypothetical protein C7C56_016485 [Massilia glaciei]
MRATAATVAVLALFAAAFWYLQNVAGLIGGEIAPAKLAWLCFALLFWLGLPLLIICDPRTPPRLAQAFGSLLALMAARGVVELVMLYVFHNWSPHYGIAHDLLCAAVLAYFLALAWREGEHRGGKLASTLSLHGIVTTLMFVPEIWFAYYMHTNFGTMGGEAIYFVPDAEKHRHVLNVTAGVVAALAIYLPLFLGFWFHGPTLRHRP